jgi:hypothetical protein
MMKSHQDGKAPIPGSKHGLRGVAILVLSMFLIYAMMSVITWSIYVLQTPHYPNAVYLKDCKPSAMGFYRAAGVDVAFFAESVSCFTTHASLQQVSQWYQNSNWEYAGKVGGYWSRTYWNFGFIRITWDRVAYPSFVDNQQTRILTRIDLDLLLGVRYK